MQEVVFEILPYLLSLSNKTSENAINAVRNRLKILKERAKTEVANNNALKDFRHNLFFNEERAVVRMLFRHPAARETLVRLAGKLLQRKEVCNKPGSYSARTQRKGRFGNIFEYSRIFEYGGTGGTPYSNIREYSEVGATVWKSIRVTVRNPAVGK